MMYIHTLGRPTNQATLKALHVAGLRPTLVVQEHEAHAHKAWKKIADILVLPPDIRTLSPTRQYLLENCPDRFMILFDDDLRFSRKDPNDRTKMLAATPADIYEMVQTMMIRLRRFCHVGVSAREGNNRKELSQYKNERMMRVLGYDRHRVPPSCRFDRIPTKQDFDMTLQLLRNGLQNCVLYEWANDQVGGSNSQGGCAAYRTEAMNEAAAQELKRLHPDFVSLVQRKNTNWKGFGSEHRTEVMVQWKRALRAALE